MATATMARSAAGLDSPRDDWSLALCAGRTSWTSGYVVQPGARGGPTVLALKLAHLCRNHCLLFAACQRMTAAQASEGLRPFGSVQAGLVWRATFSVADPIEPREIGHGAWCTGRRPA